MRKVSDLIVRHTCDDSAFAAVGAHDGPSAGRRLKERAREALDPARERALPQRPSGRSPLGVGHGIVDPLLKNGVISHGVHGDANPAWTHGFAAHLSRPCAVSAE